VELIHTYSLIHDDLPAMDNDTVRRGRPTLHVVRGEGIAILAGDALQAEAFGLLAREPHSTDPDIIARKLRVIDLVSRAAGPEGMVGGQAIDLEAIRPAPGHNVPLMDEARLEAMHARKTGALIRVSAVAGAIMAGGTAPLVDAVHDFGREAGLAFQIVDDILDIEGGSELLGKTAGKDAAAGKPTYPAFYGLEKSRELANACLERAEAALARVGLEGSALTAIARWMVERRH
jgi:geranylgeranyl pyrophosphate synthase